MRSLSVDLAVDVLMSDGTVLVADVIRPSGGVSLPAIVVRTPYNRRTPASRSLQIDALGLAEAGYAVVIQDVRGRFASGGDHVPFVHEARDGLDTVGWVAGQHWSNGRVAMAGTSYLGFCQLAAAVSGPEPLEAIMPALTACDVREGWIREGGELNSGLNLAWMLGALLADDPRTLDREAVLSAHADPVSALGPDSRAADLIARSPLAHVWSNWESSPDPYPDVELLPSSESLARLSIPALVIAGWFDVFQPSSFDLYRALRPTASLLVGPWGHAGLPLGRRQGLRDHGPSAALDLSSVQRSFLERHLRDGGPDPDAIRVFATGANTWESFVSWPPPGQSTTLFPDHLGGLTASPTPATITVTLDPADPTPAVGGRVYPWEPSLVPGPFDQTCRDSRPDVCCFSSAPLEAPLFVAGPVDVTVSSGGASGGMLFATLSDRDPDGPAWNVADGVASVTGSTTAVSLGHAAHLFEIGHRIRLSLSFGAYPRFRWSPGDGHRTIDTGHTRLDLWTV